MIVSYTLAFPHGLCWEVNAPRSSSHGGCCWRKAAAAYWTLRKPMKLLRRAFLHLAAGAAALPAASGIAYPQSRPTGQPSEPPVRPLAERLAAYADGLRYDDIDAVTIERVKTHVIDTIGCGIGAFDERPVGICRSVALAVGGHSTIIGTDRRTTPDLA